MKKIVAILMALIVLMTAGSSLAVVDVNELRSIVDEFLKSEELYYSYDEEYDCFDITFSVENTLTSVEASIYVNDDMVSVSVDCPIRIPQDKMEKMAIFTTLVNNDIYYSQFRLDMETGYLKVRAENSVEEVMPGFEEMKTLLYMPVNYMDDYGDAIAAISSTDVDPYTAYGNVATE